MTLNAANLKSQPSTNGLSVLLTWMPIIIGLAALLLPTFYELARNLWDTEEQGHGPLILAVSLYYFWQKREVFIQPAKSTSPILGSLILGTGLLLYAVGRSQSIYIFEVGSLIPILAGMLLIMRGMPGLRSFWFPILFLVFMIPLPGSVIDALTGPLKQYVSIVVENLLYHLGYPIARNGVVLSIGYYQLLVADACSGLNSMFSLSALGFLYLYIMQYRNWFRNSLILASILPIAFTANVVRVIIITLVTYYWGDEAGQGFIHGFAGIVLFIVALLSFMLWDWILELLFKQRRQTA
ncbi:MAG: exosortase B [Sulfuriferula sp.]|nr:exosortase B [Sulfuriferula sp.]